MTEQLSRPVRKLGDLVTDDAPLRAVVSAPENFRFGEVSADLHGNPLLLADLPPSLEALADFTGNWTGTGFNTIFRPHHDLPADQAGDDPFHGDNVLELNLTQETLSFSPSLGSVPNRGMVQPDAFLNGVPYLQSISDVTVAGKSVGIHVEPGLWMMVPPTDDPQETRTYARMASIPHGTTLVAQGTARTFAGPPDIPAVNITPSFLPGGPLQPFPSQNAAAQNTARIPQDLTAWIAAGTITQAMLDDPNSVLRNHIAGQTIVETTEISVTSQPAAPLFGGGTDNIAFLKGDAASAHPNADAVLVTSTFWIETVQHHLVIPPFENGQTTAKLPLPNPGPVAEPRHLIITPPQPIVRPFPLSFTTKQIQYTQTVNLNFNGLRWPHVSVATLTPAGHVQLPPGVWN